jgi:hypothetical protein
MSQPANLKSDTDQQSMGGIRQSPARQNNKKSMENCELLERFFDYESVWGETR